MDAAIADIAARRPGRLAAHSMSQDLTFGDPSAFRLVASGIVTDRYDMRVVADQPAYLGAIGRISPEKGLHDVAELSARTGWPVKVWGRRDSNRRDSRPPTICEPPSVDVRPC